MLFASIVLQKFCNDEPKKTSVTKTPNGQKYRYRFEFAEPKNIGLAVSAFVIIMRRDSVE